MGTFRTISDPNVDWIHGHKIRRRVHPSEEGSRSKRTEFVNIPLKELAVVAVQSGPAVKVYLVLWQQASIHNKKKVMLTTCQLAKVGISRRAKYRALKALSRAGLVTVGRSKGANPLVMLKRFKPKKCHATGGL